MNREKQDSQLYLKLYIIMGILLLFFFTVTAVAETGGKWGNLDWTLSDDGLLTICGEGEMDGFDSSSNDAWRVYRYIIKQVVIGDGITSVGYFSFYDCENLISISLPESIVTIRTSAFEQCRSLTELIIPNSVKTIEDWSFSYCINLNDVTLSNNLISIRDFAFCESGLSRISIPSSVISIGNGAFYYCHNLTDISLPENIVEIGEAAFTGCSKLIRIDVDDNNENFYSYNGVLYDKSLTSLLACPGIISELQIPQGVVRIESSAFSFCDNLTHVTIPDSVIFIGNSAFSYCQNLENIAIPNSVTSIGSHAFAGCKSIQQICLPDSVTRISEGLFEGCSSLENILIPNSITSIDAEAFISCSSLKYITIPDSVVSIGRKAFSNCISLSHILLSDSISKIASFTFDNCQDLKSIAIPDNVSVIEDGAFRDCTSLYSITMPSNVKKLGEQAFYNTTVHYNHSFFIMGETTDFDIDVFNSEEMPTIYCYEYSDAEGWALENDYKIILLDNYDPQTDRTLSLPEKVLIAVGYTERLNVIVYPDFDKPGIEWISSNTNVVSVNDGIITAHTTGVAMITAIVNNVQASCKVEVYDIDAVRTVALPEQAHLAVGSSQKLHVSVIPNFDNPIVSWSSSDPSVVAVEEGKLSAMSVGTATVTARVGSAQANCTVTVYIPASAFELDKTEVWLVAKNNLQLGITDIYPAGSEIVQVSWNSSDTTLATVDENGLVSTKKPGDITIIATSDIGITRECVIHICYPVTEIVFSESDINVKLGLTRQLTAEVIMRTQNCVNHLVTFSSNDENVAAVDAETGIVTGISEGSAVITATAESGVTASCTVMVVDPSIFILPSSTTEIAARAFAGLEDVDVIVIPEAVTQIAANAFEGSAVTLSVKAGSYAETWAIEHEAAYIVRP